MSVVLDSVSTRKVDLSSDIDSGGVDSSATPKEKMVQVVSPLGDFPFREGLENRTVLIYTNGGRPPTISKLVEIFELVNITSFGQYDKTKYFIEFSNELRLYQS